MRFGLLTELLPALSDELAALLRDADEGDLARQIPELELVRRCGCGDSFCASFYTAEKPQGAWDGEHRNLVLRPTNGMLIVDVVDDRIAFVEVLDRPDFKALLDRTAPMSRQPSG